MIFFPIPSSSLSLLQLYHTIVCIQKKLPEVFTLRKFWSLLG